MRDSCVLVRHFAESFVDAGPYPGGVQGVLS